MEIVLRGIGVAPGIAIGPALLFDVDRFDVPCYAVADAEAEIARFDRAVAVTRDYLNNLYRQTAHELGEKHADIFTAHLMVLDDVTLREEVVERIRREKINAEHIVHDAVQKYVRAMEAANDARFRERAADLADVADRVLRNLLEAERPNLKRLERPSAVIAHDLSPSDTATMDLDNVLGIALDAGSATSHTAILARALELPAVVGLSDVASVVEANDTVIIDGAEGQVVIRPAAETLAYYRAAQRALEQHRESLARVIEQGPARTRDGVEIPLMANIELPLEIPHGRKVHAQGIGLYRTEYLYLNRDTVPTEEEQYDNYRQVVEAMAPHPVTIRTMDIGGDKLVEHLQILRENNPQLGWRAVRFCLARPDLFKDQLRAILRASAAGKVQIMFPMISGLEELRAVKALLREAMDELARTGIPYDAGIRIGSMIEIPSAVALANLLARECDFFSIGTNDLIQYSLAVDRGNEKVAHLYEPAHPAVLYMIKRTADAARAAGIPCALCGEMAGDPLHTDLLLGLGVTSLSMSAIALPAVRAEVLHATMAEARALAAQALDMATAAEIKRLLRAHYDAKGALQAYLAGPAGLRHA